MSFYIIFFLLITAYTVVASRWNCFFGDDSFYACYIYCERIFDCLNFNFTHGGGYIGLFLCKLLSFYIPFKAGIHPEHFITYPCGVIRGLLTAVILLLLSRFMTVNNKSGVLNKIAFASAALFFAYITGLHAQVLHIQYAWWRYVFSILFFAGFFYNLYVSFINEQKDKRKFSIITLLLTCICAFVTGTASEIEIFSACVFPFAVIFYNCIMYFVSKKNMFNLDINFFLPLIFLYTAMFKFVSCYDFQAVVQSRNVGYVIPDINMIYDFCSQFAEIYVKNEYFLFCSYLTVFLTALFFAIRRRNFKIFMFAFIFQISINLVMFSLILCGRTEYVSGNYFIAHNNVLLLYKLLNLIPFFIYSDFIFINLNKKILKAVFYAAFLVFALFMTHHMFEFENLYNPKIFYDEFKGFKTNAYKINKMLRFYLLKKEKPVLDNNFRDYMLNNPLSAKYMYLEVDAETGFDFVDDPVAIFYEKGGAFSDEELEKLDFTRLSDDDFVLNKK